MLTIATVDAVEKYGDLVYPLALDPARSCYPTYTDGIKTKDDFLRAARNAANSATSELLLFYVDGQFEGWISYFWIPEDRYLQLDGCNIRRETGLALAELMARLNVKFPGYTVYFGFPADNQEAVCFLTEQGFQCIEADWNHSFFFGSYLPGADFPCVEQITRDNFSKFRTVYHPEPNDYWNTERIFQHIDDWLIFVYNQAERPIAAVFLTGSGGYFELYGAVFADGILQEDVFRALLTSALNACKAAGAEFLTFFCSDEVRHLLPSLGFQCIGQYVLYIKALAEPST